MPLFVVGVGLVLAAFGFKVAAVPFQMWTPDVYQGAPSPVTAFMSVGVKAAAFAALMRVFLALFPSLAANLAPILAVLSALTMMLLAMCWQFYRPTSSGCWRFLLLPMPVTC